MGGFGAVVSPTPECIELLPAAIRAAGMTITENPRRVPGEVTIDIHEIDPGDIQPISLQIQSRSSDARVLLSFTPTFDEKPDRPSDFKAQQALTVRLSRIACALGGSPYGHDVYIWENRDFREVLALPPEFATDITPKASSNFEIQRRVKIGGRDVYVAIGAVALPELGVHRVYLEMHLRWSPFRSRQRTGAIIAECASALIKAPPDRVAVSTPPKP